MIESDGELDTLLGPLEMALIEQMAASLRSIERELALLRQAAEERPRRLTEVSWHTGTPVAE